jgi:hypothetical protein
VIRVAVALEFSLLVFSGVVGFANGTISGDAADAVESAAGAFVFLNALGLLVGIAYLIWRWAL